MIRKLINRICHCSRGFHDWELQNKERPCVETTRSYTPEVRYKEIYFKCTDCKQVRSIQIVKGADKRDPLRFLIRRKDRRENIKRWKAWIYDHKNNLVSEDIIAREWELSIKKKLPLG
jgi:hypothetical protein